MIRRASASISLATTGDEMIIKRIGIGSAARMYGAMTAAMGLIFGVILAIASTVGAGLSDDAASGMFGMAMGVGAVILLPLVYGCLGLVMGAIGALLYNLFAGMVGGLKVDVE